MRATHGIGDTLPACAQAATDTTTVNRAALLLALALAMSACGLKGPLTLPAPKAPAATPAPGNTDTKEEK
jgi:predicted small lipoprotein YifL